MKTSLPFGRGLRVLTIALCGHLSASLSYGDASIFRFHNMTDLDDDQIYLFASAQDDGLYDITYGGAPNASGLSTLTNANPLGPTGTGYSVTLDQIRQSNGNHDLNIGHANSLAIYVGLDSGPYLPPSLTPSLPSLTGARTGAGAVPWSNSQYGTIEATVINNNDNVNLTAINSVGVPMWMQSGSETRAFTQPNLLPSLRTDLQTNLPYSQYPGTTNTLRYVGPNQAGAGTLTFPNTDQTSSQLPDFGNYISHTRTWHDTSATNETNLKGQVSILRADNWQFDYDFTLDIDNDGNLTVEGDITVTNTTGSGGGGTESGLEMLVHGDGQGSDPTTYPYIASNFIYAAPAVQEYIAGKNGSNPEVYTYGGSTQALWESVAALTDPGTGQQVTFDDFLQFVAGHIMGDLSFGFAYGFIASEETLSDGVTLAGTAPSEDWYADGQTNVFEDLQPTDDFFSIYSEAIGAVTSTIYTHPYSDRMKDPSFDNSINLTQPNQVVDFYIYNFNTVIPEPSYISLGVFALASAIVLRRRRGRTSG